MSISKFIFTYGFLPSLHIESIHRPATRISLYSSTNFANVNKRHLWGKNKRVKKDDQSRRFLVPPGPSPPSEPPFNFIKWIVGVAITLVLPFFSHKWASVLKLTTAVKIAEEKVVVFENVAEGVKKVAEAVTVVLPEGGLRNAMKFVEHVARIVNKDAHLVEDLIHKVEAVEKEVEECVEYGTEEATTHEHSKEEKNTDDKQNNYYSVG